MRAPPRRRPACRRRVDDNPPRASPPCWSPARCAACRRWRRHASRTSRMPRVQPARRAPTPRPSGRRTRPISTHPGHRRIARSIAAATHTPRNRAGRRGRSMSTMRARHRNGGRARTSPHATNASPRGSRHNAVNATQARPHRRGRASPTRAARSRRRWCPHAPSRRSGGGQWARRRRPRHRRSGRPRQRRSPCLADSARRARGAAMHLAGGIGPRSGAQAKAQALGVAAAAPSSPSSRRYFVIS